MVDGLDGNWLMHGVKEHKHLGGVCLVMQSRACANDVRSAEVGVTVDLVPVYKTTHQLLNEKADVFLPYTLDEYAIQ